MSGENDGAHLRLLRLRLAQLDYRAAPIFVQHWADKARTAHGFADDSELLAEVIAGDLRPPLDVGEYLARLGLKLPTDESR